ncbi:MAG TPA: inositol monophosphatase [Acidimicrobiales bacterium]|nr:inositol monophosphatase [Acidimicrobiales bacterium]
MAIGAPFLDAVAAAIREVSATAIEPRFSFLAQDDVRAKSPGELVTVADEEAEQLLEARLAGLGQGAPVVGEEACAADPSRLQLLGSPRAWLVDPIDGTANFVTGSPDWGVMVALLEEGATVAAWIWQPLRQAMFMAARGGGVLRDGRPIRRGRPAATAAGLRGRVSSRFLPPEQAAAVERNRGRFGSVLSGRGSAAIEYPALVEGAQDFCVYWRTLAWDHAAGALLVEEAGGVVGRFDGSPYRPAEEGSGLIVAADETSWQQARSLVD